MKNVGIIGVGKIGKTIAAFLNKKPEIFKVHLAALVPWDKNESIMELDASNIDECKRFIKGKDLIITSTTHDVNINIAKSCAELGVAYFDLTEDTEVSEYIKNLDTKTFMMPQCGLAPGAVNIIAANLISQFEEPHKVKMRVGALPKYPTNAMSYYLTWSTDGLLNEYVNYCDVISHYDHIKAHPLDGIESIYIDGSRYEAFNTSGGSASMCETYKGKVRTLSYKTIRYPGHCDKMKFLLEDLNLKHNKQKFIELFDQEVPYTTADVVVMLVSVIGKKDGKLQEVTYSNKIYGDPDYSAIQRATASGVCSVALAYAEGKLTGTGYIKQEDIPYQNFITNLYGEIYNGKRT